MIYTQIKQKGFLHEGSVIDVIYPKPIYPIDRNPQGQRVFWQYEVDQYGGEHERPVGDGWEVFKCQFSDSLYNKTRPHIDELLSAGLIQSQNNGYNSYTYFPR